LSQIRPAEWFPFTTTKETTYKGRDEGDGGFGPPKKSWAGINKPPGRVVSARTYDQLEASTKKQSKGEEVGSRNTSDKSRIKFKCKKGDQTQRLQGGAAEVR